MFNITLHESKETFTITFSIMAVVEFINIKHVICFILKTCTCYRIIVVTFGISDLNSVWHTEYYSGKKESVNLLSSIITGNMFYIFIY